jgi:hypothetical protein
MKYLPFEDFEIHTTLTSDEVYYRLCAAVDAERKWWIFTNKPFWGEVERRDFRIWRATWWNSNIGPVVSGKIWSEVSGCCVVIRMRMPWFGFLFSSLAFGFLWLSFFVGHANLVVQKIQSGIWQVESLGEWLLNVVLYIVFIGSIYLMSLGIFKKEVRRVRDYLLWMWQADKESIIYRDEFLGITEPQIIRSILFVTLVVSLGWIVFSLLW